MNLELKNKIVLISGVTGGIGEAICQAFLEEGAITIPLFRGKIERLDSLFQWMETQRIPKSRCVPENYDLKKKEGVKTLVKDIINKHRRIDILINCAGKSVEKPFLLHENEDFEEMLGINLIALAILSREVLRPMMKQRSGNIINISSLLSHRFGRGVSAYAAAKAGVDRLTESLAAEMGKKGIRVNSICPGVIKTKMSDALTFNLGDQILDRTPMMRYGAPKDIAQASLFLASDKMASFITGQRIVVDGGISLL